MSARVPLTFRIFKGEQLLREETLALGVIKIGKVASAHLRIDDESVSRMHAILEVDNDGTVHVIDLGSTRGTFVNGHKINKAKLQSGDSMKIGDMRVELAIGAATNGQPAAAPAVRAPVLPTPAIQAPALRTPVTAAPPIPMSAVRAPALPMSAAHAPAAPMSSVQAPAIPVAVRAPVAAMPTTLYNAAATDSNDDVPGAQAIEVAAMLGDSVVDVKHCIDPKSGKISSKTWGMFAAGVACLATSATAFCLSVHNAAFNKGALDAWTRLAHRPSYAYRPHLLSAGYDWLAFGGFAFGILMMVLGLMRMRNEKRSPYFRIGTAPGVELPVENAPTADFPLVAPSGNDFVFNYGAGIDGEMLLDGRSTPLAELAATGRARPSLTTAGAIEVPIPARARIRARLGQTSFLVSAVPQPRRHVTPLLAGLESRVMSYFAGSLAVHLGIWALLQQIPVEESTVAIDLSNTDPTSISSNNTTNEDVPPPKDPDDGNSGGTDGKAAAMTLDEGAAGTTKSTREDGHMRMKDNKIDPQLARQQAIEDARNAGVLGNVAMLSNSFASLTATSQISSGFDDANVWGPMFGAEGEGKGSFGYGRSDYGAGGGCRVEPCGIIGTSRYGTIGTGDRAGDGWGGPGHGHGHMRGHDAGVPPPPRLGQATGSGDIDKATIRRYIKQNIEKIGYCYNKEVLAHPSIEGTVVVSFFISPTGAVQGSKGTGFDNNVSTCVADVVAGIEFPRPRGGGGVQVNYPFIFHTTGS